MKHNNQLPNAHFHKDWQRHVKTWFNQPGSKKRRRNARVAKAAKIAPRPVDGLLRPAVRCQTLKYNIKVRAGRGFSLEELKVAGINRKWARTVGIAIDHRRRNRSEESLKANVERLKLYKSKLIVFPKNAKKPSKTDSAAADLKAVKQLVAPLFPIVRQPTPVVTTVAAVKSDEAKAQAYATLHKLRFDAKLKGIREIRAKEKAQAEADAKK